jgi:hypothetical protein
VIPCPRCFDGMVDDTAGYHDPASGEWVYTGEPQCRPCDACRGTGFRVCACCDSPATRRDGEWVCEACFSRRIDSELTECAELARERQMKGAA